MLTQPAGKDHSLKDYSSSKMIQIILRASTTLAVGWIILFMGVNSVNISDVDFTTESADAFTPHSLTSVIMDLRITNRVYNDSLADQHSDEYTTLKQEVDQLFADIYLQSFNFTHLIYLGTDEMIFSNGSVIATSRLLFGPTQVNPELVRRIFSPVYKQIPSPALEIDLNYIDNELPTEEPFEGDKNFSRPPPRTYTETSFTTPDTMTDSESLTSRLPATHTPSTSSSVTVGNITHLIRSTTSTSFNSTSIHSNTTTNSPINNTTLSAAYNSTTNEVTNGTTTEASNETNINTPNGATTETPNRTTTTAPVGSITAISKGTTTTDAITTVANAPITTTPKITTTTTTTSTVSTSITTTTKPTFIHSTVVKPTIHRSTTFPSAPLPKTSPVNQSAPAVTALVPEWAVALLAVAGVSLFLLIILIVLVVIWCCCPKRRVFVNEPDEMNPPMYFNPDIPMYSTQTTFDTTNGKQTDVREKPPKNRTGMYVVNK